MTFDEYCKTSGRFAENGDRKMWEAAILAERVACYKAIDAIDDGEAPEYRACQEAIMERSNV